MEEEEEAETGGGSALRHEHVRHLNLNSAPLRGASGGCLSLSLHVTPPVLVPSRHHGNSGD